MSSWVLRSSSANQAGEGTPKCGPSRLLLWNCFRRSQRESPQMKSRIQVKKCAETPENCVDVRAPEISSSVEMQKAATHRNRTVDRPRMKQRCFPLHRELLDERAIAGVQETHSTTSAFHCQNGVQAVASRASLGMLPTATLCLDLSAPSKPLCEALLELPLNITSCNTGSS